jgi:hypothetical protein
LRERWAVSPQERNTMDTRIADFIWAQFGIAGLVVVTLLVAVFKLGSDFAKMRTELQQQATKDLLNKRFAAYGNLWSRQLALAIYSEEPFDSAQAGELAKQLSAWYFSADGGMFLTVRAREFYFALQDITMAAADAKHWRCDRRPRDPKQQFIQHVLALEADQRPDWFTEDAMKQPQSFDPDDWRALCKTLAKQLAAGSEAKDPPNADATFCIVQQVSSVLRTNLADELHSRLEARAAKPA